MQSLTFVERALPSDLAPDRDIGASLHGDVFGVFTYDVGVFNGVPDGNSADTDTGGKKDVDGRIFVHPFVPFHLERLQNIGIGFAFTQGGQQGNVTTTELAPYKSAGQITFFSYLVDSKNIATVIAQGNRFRYMPQFHAYVGAFGA
jgi:phosphate-selective porin OprO/OprP